MTDIERLVREGIERFILKDATIHDFLKTMRSVARREKVYSHQLTRAVFSRIVKQAVKTRNRQQRRRESL